MNVVLREMSNCNIYIYYDLSNIPKGSYLQVTTVFRMFLRRTFIIINGQLIRMLLVLVTCTKVLRFVKFDDLILFCITMMPLDNYTFV